VEQYLPGVVNQVIDYQTESVVDFVGPQSINFVYQTLFSLTDSIPLLKPDTGVVVAIADVPPASILREVMGPRNLHFWAGWFANAIQYYYNWKTRGTNLKVGFNSSGPPGRRGQSGSSQAHSVWEDQTRQDGHLNQRCT
jgi:hypothetical protein